MQTKKVPCMLEKKVPSGNIKSSTWWASLCAWHAKMLLWLIGSYAQWCTSNATRATVFFIYWFFDWNSNSWGWGSCGFVFLHFSAESMCWHFCVCYTYDENYACRVNVNCQLMESNHFFFIWYSNTTSAIFSSQSKESIVQSYWLPYTIIKIVM